MAGKPTAVITGGAGGIGRAVCERLIRDGWFVVIADADEEAGTRAAEELGADDAAPVRCNVADEREVASFWKKALDLRKAVHALVNNAGIVRDSVIWRMPAEDFDAVLSVNLRGAWLMCREAAAVMRKQRSGAIVNIASRAWMGNPGQTNYSASKAGMIGLTRALALELARNGINVNAVAPGLIDTPLTQGLPPDVLEKLLGKQPTGKMGRPEDVAGAVSFLLSADSAFITGQVLHVDGGRSFAG